MLQLSTQPQAEHETRVAVVAAHGELRLVALGSFEDGERILQLEGLTVALPTRYTIQVGRDEHLEVAPGTSWQALLVRYPWRFLNHACAPNTRIVGRELIALGHVPAMTELSFDYEANEWSMAEPFDCRCAVCGGHQVRGFAHLDRSQRERRHGRLPRHLIARLHEALPSARDTDAAPGPEDPRPRLEPTERGPIVGRGED